MSGPFFFIYLAHMLPYQNYFSRKWLIPVAFALFAFIFFPQVGLLQHPLKWDAIDCFLAWRLNVSDAINNGEMPFWSAFQHLGFPLHADPDTGAIYPIVWIISLVYGYDFYALNIEFCFHIFIAGWGMFRLMKHFSFSDTTAFLIGLAFMSNGVFVSNAQNFAFLIGMAWFPWVFQSLRESLRTPSMKNAFVLSTLLFLWLSGSYPGVVIIGAYVLFAYIIYYFIANASAIAKNWKSLLSSYIFRVGIPVIFIIAFPIVASFETYDDITRTAGIDASRINENPFPPKAYVSWFLPYAVGTRAGIEWGSDFSMINFFLGFPFLLGLSGWLVQRKMDRRSILALAVALGLMLAALGALTPIRMWLAHFPAMGLFRHPSIFRFIASVFFLLAAAGGLEYLLFHATERRKRIAVALVGIPFLFFIGYGFAYISAGSFSMAFDEWVKRVGESQVSVEQRYVIQGVLFFLLLLPLFFLKGKKWLWTTVVIVSAALSIQMNMYSTVVSEGVLSRYNKKLHQVIEGRSAYAGEPLYSYHTDSIDIGIPVIWRNEAIYLRKPAWDGYNSLILKSYDRMEKGGGIFNVIQKPLLFPHSGRTKPFFSNWKITTNTIEASVFSEGEFELALQQSFIKGWKAIINGESVEVRALHDIVPLIDVPRGSHRIKFEYKPTWTVRSMILSGVSWSLLFLIVLYFRFKPFGRS